MEKIIATLIALSEAGALDVDANGKAWVKLSGGHGDSFATVEVLVDVKALAKMVPKS